MEKLQDLLDQAKEQLKDKDEQLKVAQVQIKCLKQVIEDQVRDQPVEEVQVIRTTHHGKTVAKKVNSKGGKSKYDYSPSIGSHIDNQIPDSR